MEDYSYKFRYRPVGTKPRNVKRTPKAPSASSKKRSSLRLRGKRRTKADRNVRVTRIASPNNEPTVAVNPLDENTIVSSYNADLVPLGLARSTNGGKTFDNRILPIPKGFEVASDPVLDSGFPVGHTRKGFFLLGGLAFNGSGEDGTIYVQRSVDNGKTFSAPIVVNRGFGERISNDKPNVAVDKSAASPFIGNAYISYTRFFDNGRGSVIFFHRSTDGGRTWSKPVRISEVRVGFPFVQGSSIGIGLSGEVFAAWIDYNGDRSSIRVRRSDDGGVTFGPDVSAAAITPIQDPLPVPGWDFRVLTFANVRADTSGNFPGAVYAVWDDLSEGSANVLLARSVDNGATWSDPIRVNDSRLGTQNFFSAAAVSPHTGTVNVIYYTNRRSGKRIDVYLARSRDGGRSFERNLRITDKSFNPNADPTFGTPSTFIGDYITTAFKGESDLSVWTDTRTGRQEIFSGRAKRK
ncbi:sialidase family protein [Cohnella xylanilytica]|uniref:sialidase family protein n=1 Tax=Cohnella xylanilytica TaxID=557555 RepID=UPI001C88725D|nr:sialidase family protein [Cohnella xylanilytica]